MREIRFRAWDIKNKMMSTPFKISDIESDGGYGDIYQAKINAGFEIYSYELDDESKYILMQYTGLKDRNGKEIYEGDIVSDGEINDEVTFDDGMFWLKYSEEPLYEYISIWEVIGNIHENSNLL